MKIILTSPIKIVNMLAQQCYYNKYIISFTKAQVVRETFQYCTNREEKKWVVAFIGCTKL